VADSEPEREYQETLNKAAAMLRAVEMAEAGLDPGRGPTTDEAVQSS